MSGTGVDTHAAPATDDAASAGESDPGQDRPASGGADATGADEAAGRSVHRLRDLDRRGRWWAVAFAAALLLAPVLAFAWAVPEWTPAGDPARMALRALDVGTEDTPLTGLPSTSALYVGGTRHVNHPGPVHYYMLAPAIRLLGAPVGMLVVSLVIVGASLLLTAWATFRQLGPPGGVLAVVVLSAITFTTGASTLVNPVSSNIARYPFLCSVVLLWCLLCGDLRLLPLAAVMVTFAAQQHLSVMPTMVITTLAVGGLGLAVWLWGAWQRRRPQAPADPPTTDGEPGRSGDGGAGDGRAVPAPSAGEGQAGRSDRSDISGRPGRPGERGEAAGSPVPAHGGLRQRARGWLGGAGTMRGWLPGVERREIVVWGGAAGVVGLALWAPVLVQQLFGESGNLSRMIHFATHDERPTLGYRSAVRQVAHAIGLPPILGQLNLSGVWFLEEVSPLTWVSAAVVAAAVTALGWRWLRQGRWRRVTVPLMAGLVAVAGLVNGASVPQGIETIRLPLYHWAWPLVFFVVVALGLAGLDVVDRFAAAHDRRRQARWGLAGLSLLAVVVPAVVNPAIDRDSNTLFAAYTPVERRYITEVADAVMAQGDRLDEPTVLPTRENAYDGLHQALAIELTERGFPVLQPGYEWQSVGQRRLVDRDTVQSGLVLVVENGVPDPDAPDPVPGELVADVRTESDLDEEAYEALVAEIEGVDEVVLGDDLEQAVADLLPESAPEVLYRTYLDNLLAEPREAMLNPVVLELVRDHPPEQPRLDRRLVDRVLDTLPEPPGAYRMRVYRLDRAELLAFAAPNEVS